MKKVIAKVPFLINSGLFGKRQIERVVECDVLEEYNNSVKVKYFLGTYNYPKSSVGTTGCVGESGMLPDVPDMNITIIPKTNIIDILERV